jgi:hypothetical protein
MRSLSEIGGRSRAARMSKGISTKLMILLIHVLLAVVETISGKGYGLSSMGKSLLT